MVWQGIIQQVYDSQEGDRLRVEDLYEQFRYVIVLDFSKQFELEFYLLENWVRDNPVRIVIDKVIAGVNKVFLGTNDKDLYTMAVLRWSHLA